MAVSFVLPSIGRIGIYSTTYAADLSVSYQVDLLGRLSRSRQASWTDLLAAEANRQALVYTVIAEVVRARVDLATVQRQLQLADATAQSWQSTANIVEDRYRLGLVDAADRRRAVEWVGAASGSGGTPAWTTCCSSLL